MDSGTRRAALSSWLSVLALAASLAAAAAYAREPSASAGGAAVRPQDITRIESRIGQIERRFYSVEASIRSLEQQLRLAGANTQRAEPAPEFGLLRSELEALRRRLAEVECGLARVDERTLSASARESRRRSQAGAGDPCRLNADAPLPPPARP